MQINFQKGSAGVELVYVMFVFLFFLSAVSIFSKSAVTSHSLSLELQNRVESKMMNSGRVVCLENIGAGMETGRAKTEISKEQLQKTIVYVTKKICERY